MDDLWEVAIGLTGIAGVGAFVFLSLYKEWIIAPVLMGLTKVQKYRLLMTFLVLTFAFAAAAIGLSAYQTRVSGNSLTISFEEAKAMVFYRYEEGGRALYEIKILSSLPEEDELLLDELIVDYGHLVNQSRRALEANHILRWHEMTNEINALLRTGIAKKYVPEAEISSMAYLRPIRRSLNDGGPFDIQDKFQSMY